MKDALCDSDIDSDSVVLGVVVPVEVGVNWLMLLVQLAVTCALLEPDAELVSDGVGVADGEIVPCVSETLAEGDAEVEAESEIELLAEAVAECEGEAD